MFDVIVFEKSISMSLSMFSWTVRISTRPLLYAGSIIDETAALCLSSSFVREVPFNSIDPFSLIFTVSRPINITTVSPCIERFFDFDTALIA